MTTKPLAKYEFLVPVDYKPLPPQAALEKEFGKGSVNAEIFSGSDRFERHASCVFVDQTPGKRVMSVAMPPRELRTTEDIIAWIDRQNGRPSIESEFYAFARALPDLKKSHPMLARFISIKSLGSFARLKDDHRLRYVPELSSFTKGETKLQSDWFDNAGRRGSAFLIVRKDDAKPRGRHDKKKEPAIKKTRRATKSGWVSITDFCEENGYRIGDPALNDRNFPPVQRSSLRKASGSVLLFDSNTTDNVLRKFKEKGVAPATLFSLSDLGELALDHRYIALGSWCQRDGKKRFPFLRDDGRKIVLGLAESRHGWHEGDIFFSE